MWILQPRIYPRRRSLLRDPAQVGREVLGRERPARPEARNDADRSCMLARVDRVASFAAGRFEQPLAFLDERRILDVGLQRRNLGMRREPLLRILRRTVQDERGQRSRLGAREREVRHARVPPEAFRVGDPSQGPRRVELCRREFQVRADLRNVLVARHQMASRASRLLEHPFPLDPVRRDRFASRVVQRADVDMALDASGLHLGAPEHRRIPIRIVAMRHPHRAHRRPLSVVTRRASEFVGRMLQYDLIEVAVRAKRLGRILEALLVGAHMTALASIDPRDRLVEGVAVEVVDRGLLNPRNLRITEQDRVAELDRDHPGVGLVQ